MKLLKMIFIPIDGVLSRAFAAAGALAAVQFPNFVVHYMQRLGGHIDELRRMVELYQQAAASSGKTIYQYISLHQTSNVPEIAKTGSIIKESVDRYAQLKEGFDQIATAPQTLKFFYFIKNADYEIARNALSNYTPGFSLNNESLAYALAGLIAAAIVYFLVKTIIVYIFETFDPTRRG